MTDKAPAKAPPTPNIGESPDAREEIIQRRLVMIQLQSDLAYFQARLGLIGEPKTTNQEAQRRTFKLLHQAVGQQMIKARKSGAGK
ncbi:MULTISPECIES: hypothetical protein [Thiorhodovibrio]|jgi:hypothetical protein|uniref:hypothetical protein n=1 Tax=Thiorhodovibrio TaxID=61593 RepID=UPI0019145746|nr:MULTISPECIES: hypothetical protein [Thiorhodovibrio]MBK5967635.1 hypothetical protein [Thiorhodovibrio winogradskyi]WPL13060.1 hypothetical protein Thiosp_02848 [Thiorhodovibrio litoralis]